MADGEGDKQVIEVEYVVRADDAIEKARKFRAEVEATKAQLQKFAAESGQSLQDLSKGMVKAFGEDTLSKIREVKKNLAVAMATEVDPFRISMAKGTARDEIKQLTANYQEYKKVVTTALSEITAAEKASAKERTNANKEMVAQQKADLKALKEAQNEYIQAWRSGIMVMSPAAQAFGKDVASIKDQMKQTAAQTGQSFNQIGQDIVNKGEKPVRAVIQAIRELNAEQKAAASGSGGFLGFLQSLGSVGQFVFGTVLGLTAVSALRSVTNWFREAAKAGFEYAQALARLEISTQILQEGGLNVTMRQTLELITRLNQEFPIFTRKQIIEGVGYIQLLSQNLKLSAAQMEDMSEVASALAVVLGKDVNDAARELALFLSSGYGEALQRAGILASKQAVVEELRRMGIEKSYNDVDQATRAQAGYNVIMRDANAIVEKSIALQEDMAYSSVKASNAWKQFTETLGIRLVPILDVIYTGVVRVTQGLQGLLGIISVNFALVEAQLARVAASIQLTYEMLSKKPNLEGIKQFAEDWNKIWSPEGFQEALKITTEALLPDIFTGFEDSAIGAANATSDAAETLGDAVEGLYEDIRNAQEDFASDMARLERDLMNDLERIDREGLRRIEESWIEYYADIESINRDAADDVIGENLKYQLDLIQINRDFNNKRAEAEQKYREKEEKAEEDFQEKMRRLREEFLFDLEDALRERDARQVLRLIRRFNLEQARLERERDQEREDRQEDYEQELEDIERQRQERLQKLAEEHQARLAEIERQRLIELRELQIKHEAELAEIQRRLEAEKEERRIRAEEQREELQIQFSDRIREIGEALATEYGVTKEMLDAIGAAYMATYGPNGVMQQALDYALAYLAQSVIAMNSIAAGFGGYGAPQPLPNSMPNTKTKQVPAFATGAQDLMVTSPQIIQVGEVPELINITPLNRIGSSGMGEMSGKDGTITLELWLSRDLEARVIDSTMTEVANVMLDIQRRR